MLKFCATLLIFAGLAAWAFSSIDWNGKEDEANGNFYALPTSDTDGSNFLPQNIILFMTDDQDVTANSLDFMPNLNKLFREEGMEFPNYFVPTGLCCPSRATILRGQYCHNTKVYDNGDLTNHTYTSGAWKKFVLEGLEKETFATILQSAAGYETALIGKYMNGYGYEATNHIPSGFDHWMGFVNHSYYGASFSENGQLFKLNETSYTTDFIRDWAIDFLKTKRNSSKPFLLLITPFTPHTPATPAKRHQHLFNDIKFPRRESFNPPDSIQQHRPAWIKELPPLTKEQISNMDSFYRNRLRSLQAIDEALESLVETLLDLGLDNNTWFFYTSDNGQHFGDNRIPAGKRQAYETDVQVPFLVRGPETLKGSKVGEVIQSVDIGPTFLDIAVKSSRKPIKVASSYPMDGKSMLPLLIGDAPPAPSTNERWAALLEMYGGSSNIGLHYKDMKNYYQNHMFPNTYQAARVINGPDWASKANLLYVEWCTGEQELYNMTNDPHQVHNLATLTSVNKLNVDLHLLHRLSQLLARLGDCKGVVCYHIENQLLNTNTSRELTFNSMKRKIQNRIPCHNPPNMSVIDTTLGRKSFAVNVSVPEPFTFGFPFADSDDIPNNLMARWYEYEHFFH